jgi:hypothetical protein
MYKLGRQPRSNVRTLLHFDTVKLAAGIDTSSVDYTPWDYTKGLPANTGVLLNDTLGCCTASAKFHRLQCIVMAITGKFIPAEDLNDLVLRFYELTTGYDPTAELVEGQNPTDQGGNMQDIAHYLVHTGMARPYNEPIDEFVAAFEVNPANFADMVFVGRECMGLDFGIECTSNVMPADGSPPPTIWLPGGTQDGGHDVIVPKFMGNHNFGNISWGSEYQMTPSFITENVNEVIAYVSKDALRDGKTVMGLDLQTWLNMMTPHGATTIN